jgi:hypothetical protein
LAPPGNISFIAARLYVMSAITRAVAAAGASIIALLLAGCGTRPGLVASAPTGGPAPTTPTSPPDPPASPTAAPTTPGPGSDEDGSTGSPVPAAETGVPDSAMIPALLGLDDYHSGKQYLPYAGPPRPCASGGHPSDAQLVRARPASGFAPKEIVAPDQQHPEVIKEYVAQYRTPSAAVTALAEIRADVKRCPGRAGKANAAGEWKWSVSQTGFAGDESLLIRLDAQTFHNNGGADGSCCTTYYLGVARQGELLVAVTSTGWELAGGRDDVARDGVIVALNYARTLRS